MSIELDHIFILCQRGAPQADLLFNLGLVEGSSNQHPGQGTANRRFFFSNTTLEFLYVHDQAEAALGPAGGLGFQDRSTVAAASPFGLIMKTVDGASTLPFEGWKYCPDYFASDQCFHVGSNSDTVEEPLCIVMPNNLAQRTNRPAPENPDWTLTDMCVYVTVPTLSHPLQEIARCRNIKVQPSKPHGMELTFNEAALGMRADFTEQLSLVINW